MMIKCLNSYRFTFKHIHIVLMCYFVGLIQGCCFSCGFFVCFLYYLFCGFFFWWGVCVLVLGFLSDFGGVFFW